MKIDKCVVEFHVDEREFVYVLDTFCILEKYGKEIHVGDLDKLREEAFDSDYIDTALTNPVYLYAIDEFKTIAVVETHYGTFTYELPYDISDVETMFTVKVLLPDEGYQLYIDSNYAGYITNLTTGEQFTEKDGEYKEFVRKLKKYWDEVEVCAGL